jgi:hypothetical protein
VILGLVSGRGEWPWRRDWSTTPNTWRLYAVWAAVCLVLGGFYLVRGNLFGVLWLVLAAAWVFVTLWVRRRSRLRRDHA